MFPIISGIMSSPLTPTPSTSTSGARGSSCAHCDDSVPHEHVDVRAELTAVAAAARRRSSVTLLVALAPLVLGLVAAAVLSDVVAHLLLVVAVAVGSLVVTAISLTVARGATRRSARVGVAAGAAVSSALAPVVGLLAGLGVTAALGGTISWPAALVAGGAGWTIAAVGNYGASAMWRKMLFEPGEQAERARAQAMASRGSEPSTFSLAWLVQGPAVGAAAVLTGLLAFAVVPLAALCAALSVRGSARRV
jgi:hypothetical protein